MRPKTWRGWLSLEDRRLEELRLEGKTVAAIARLLGRTVPSVANRVSQRRLPKFKDSAPVDRILLLQKPHTIAGLARLWGVARRSVVQFKRRMRARGIPCLPATRENRRDTWALATAASG